MTKLTPYDWQIRDQENLREHNYTGLVAIEAGGGKSLTATLAIRDASPEVTLIVAPKSTHKTAWVPTLRDNAGVEARIIGNDNKETKSALFDFELGVPGSYLATPQFVTRADVSSWTGDMLVFDEIHMGAVTPRSKLQRKVSGFTPAEARDSLAARFPMRLALSATPMRGDFSNMWGVVRFLYPERFESGDIGYDNFWGWENQRMDYSEVYTNQRDQFGAPKKVRQYLSESQPGRLISEMPCVIMHKRRETCCEAHPGGFLPTEEPQVIERTVTLTPKQRKAVQDMDRTMMAWIEDNPLVAEISLTQKQRIRQFTMAEATVEIYEKDGEEKSRVTFDLEAKSPVIEEISHILSNLPEDEAVVVYTESRRFAEVITHQLNQAGFPAAEYSGVIKADLSKFGSDYRVLVGVVSAIGTGTAGLNHVSSTEIFADQPVSLTMLTQSSARLDRLDNTRRVQRFVILDDMGVQEGRMEDLWLNQVIVSRSMRVAEGTIRV